jgi:hypothetical protein
VTPTLALLMLMVMRQTTADRSHASGDLREKAAGAGMQGACAALNICIKIVTDQNWKEQSSAFSLKGHSMHTAHHTLLLQLLPAAQTGGVHSFTSQRTSPKTQPQALSSSAAPAAGAALLRV